MAKKRKKNVRTARKSTVAVRQFNAQKRKRLVEVDNIIHMVDDLMKNVVKGTVELYRCHKEIDDLPEGVEPPVLRIMDLKENMLALKDQIKTIKTLDELYEADTKILELYSAVHEAMTEIKEDAKQFMDAVKSISEKADSRIPDEEFTGNFVRGVLTELTIRYGTVFK